MPLPGPLSNLCAQPPHVLRVSVSLHDSPGCVCGDSFWTVWLRWGLTRWALCQPQTPSGPFTAGRKFPPCGIKNREGELVLVFPYPRGVQWTQELAFRGALAQIHGLCWGAGLEALSRKHFSQTSSLLLVYLDQTANKGRRWV